MALDQMLAGLDNPNLTNWEMYEIGPEKGGGVRHFAPPSPPPPFICTCYVLEIVYNWWD